MIRQLLVFVLLLAVLLPSFSPLGTIAYYQLNRDYIAKVLCENRDKPQLHCDGKCYLAKKLKAQQDRQDKETTQLVKSMPTITLFCDALAAFEFAPEVTTPAETGTPAYVLPSYTSFLAVQHQPPRA
ncbi:hypothetical protein [Siphonobacter aquaeclarae]|uniref:hypothetical protein n=1 Tax=Siphonobacter aquaeclarae TaxID=563176 RepID=UPI002937337D|nr:hypothetical protein [Siphonobacter aquaeclarae]